MNEFINPTPNINPFTPNTYGCGSNTFGIPSSTIQSNSGIFGISFCTFSIKQPSPYEYEKIVIPESILPHIFSNMILTLFNVIIYNTATRTNFTEQELAALRFRFDMYYINSKTDTITVKIGETDKPIIFKPEFNNVSNIKNWMLSASSFLDTIITNECFYQDKIENGFSWLNHKDEYCCITFHENNEIDH